MNQALQNPYAVGHLPETAGEHLDSGGIGTCMSFNASGSLLALGTEGGQVALFDFVTKSVVSVLGDPCFGPLTAIVCVAFPAPGTGVTLLAGDRSGRVRMYDTLAKAVVVEVHFGAPVLQMEVHPTLPYALTVVTPGAYPHLVEVAGGTYAVAEGERQPTGLKKTSDGTPETRTADHGKAVRLRRENPSLQAPPALPAPKESLSVVPVATPDELVGPCAVLDNATTCVRFVPGGNRLLRGNPNGTVLCFELSIDQPARCVHAVKIPGDSAVRNIVFSNSAINRFVLVASVDKYLRLCAVPALVGSDSAADAPPTYTDAPATVTPMSVCSDAVNRTAISSAVVSPDGEFVVGAMGEGNHRVFVWRTTDGQLEREFIGPREKCIQLAWHPCRPVFASLGLDSGGVYVWERNVAENWSAFAPDFNELEQNEEYEEREDEFDVRDRADKAEETRRRMKDERETIVDVVGLGDGEEVALEKAFFVPADPREKPPVAAKKVEDKDKTGGCGNGAKKRGRSNGGGKGRKRSANGNGNGNGRRPNGMAGRRPSGGGAEVPTGPSTPSANGNGGGGSRSGSNSLGGSPEGAGGGPTAASGVSGNVHGNGAAN